MFVTEAQCYLNERILKVRIGLLWLWLLACTLLTIAEPLLRLPWLLLTSALFILAFRLWDDLADLEYDRRHLPPRCLTRSTDIQPFRVALWFQITALAGLLFFLVGGGRALAFLGLVAVLLVMYRTTELRPELRPLRMTLVLAKYPAFVLLLAHSPGDRSALLVALAAYLPPLIDEIRSSGPGMALPAVAFVGLATLSWLALMT